MEQEYFILIYFDHRRNNSNDLKMVNFFAELLSGYSAQNAGRDRFCCWSGSAAQFK